MYDWINNIFLGIKSRSTNVTLNRKYIPMNRTDNSRKSNICSSESDVYFGESTIYLIELIFPNTSSHEIIDLIQYLVVFIFEQVCLKDNMIDNLFKKFNVFISTLYFNEWIIYNYSSDVSNFKDSKCDCFILDYLFLPFWWI